MLPFDDKEDVSVSLSGAAEVVPEGGVVEATAMHEGMAQSLLVTRVAGRLAAFHNLCPHAGRRLDWAPGKFLIDQGRLVCAAHGATFDLGSGVCVSGPCKGAALRPAPLPERFKTAG